MALPDLFGGSDGAKKSAPAESSDSVDAAQDVLDAMADKDARALDLALKRHYELCEGGGMSEDETED
jgi:DNA-binding GntR family transcriptional regulator